ncbi:molybdopterin molybdotransferase MoeA [Methanothermococcus okinawensis]|uniref:Molybdenum cofactor synthesis domain protein n=1 Tax=Methanothermococcus okinawensis (strain DSM 14208 / JCM 11175 / IH1) TaxID=647113 RepID=F8ANF5_METOI|nr:molybdopterin molybdotransferase MoeA [Methanothermococcus okinawensis]AEH06223.1 molybdenum cofactor synthesis domain protein [Methanothermococcus okinawensis IH1]
MLLKDLISYNDAKNIIFNSFNELMRYKYKVVDIRSSYNKISFEDIRAPTDLPMFDKSAMDGYAVIAEDTFGASETNPIILNLIDNTNNIIKTDECVKLSTGMPLPKEANAVVMKEYCIEEDGFIEVRRGAHPYENVARVGEDVKKGDIVVKKGEVITPYHIALLSSLGIKNIKVYDLKIGLLSTGDELVDLDDFNTVNELKNGYKIVNSNSLMLYSLINEIGLTPTIYKRARDNKEEIKNSILKALGENDIVITTGGTSVGDRDYTIEAIKEIGKLLLHGVQIRPGKPFGFAKSILNDEEKFVFILSGYPVASAVQFELFFRNYFRARKYVYLPLNRNIASTLGRTDIVRVKLINKDNKTYIEPLRITGSGVLSSITKADGYVLIDENIEGYEGGDIVKVYFL